jgi:2-keto-4-pentenoate hydratase/2-oxohepta-3-ene-1,7-dioic acid hydratase in catechol pathway
MKLLYFYKNAALHLGVATQKGVVDITTAQRLRGDRDFSTSNISIDDLAQIKSIVEQATSFLEEDSLSIATCTPFTNKIICIGLNYRQHAIESGLDIPKIPVVFSIFRKQCLLVMQVKNLIMRWNWVS